MYLWLFFFCFWEGRHWSFFIGNDGGEDMEGARLPSDPRTSRQFICKAPTTPVTVSGWPRGRRDRTVVSLVEAESKFLFLRLVAAFQVQAGRS